MYESPSSKLILKRITITLGVIIGVVAIGWGVVSLLKTITPQTSVPEPSGGRVLKPAEAIEAFTKEGAIPALDPQNFTVQTSQNNITSVIYKPASSSFAVAAPTSDQALFFGKTPQTSDVNKEVGEQTTKLMESAGYKKIENTGSARSENPIYTTYETALSVCQLSSSRPAANSTMIPYHKLACIDKVTIQSEYDAITPLITLFRESGQSIPAYDEVTRVHQTEGNKAMTILNLSGNNTSTSLLFAAIDNKWAYLGNLSGNGDSQTNGKYVINADLRRVMSDPQYGDFLTKNIR